MALEPRIVLWDRLNKFLSQKFCDGEMTEEEVEKVLDECEPEGIEKLKEVCKRFGISTRT